MRSSVKLIGLVVCVVVAVFACGPKKPAPPEKAPIPPKTAALPLGDNLASQGQSRYRIVVAATASPSEKRAAQELQTHFKACTGVELPIAVQAPTAEAPKDTPAIILGCGPAAQALGVNPKPEDLGEQGYVIRTVPPNVVIAGTPAAGTLYGVYDFLESQLGVRWYAPGGPGSPGVTKTPEAKDLPLPKVDKLVRPAFAWRNTSYAWPGGDAEFHARMRDNSGGGGPDNPLGTQYSFAGTCHTYFGYISPSEFFATHPEYFSELGGVRVKDETQLCLTNPEVLEIVTERMLESMAEHPEYRQYNFSEMDWYNFCECPKCSEMNQKYGATGGTQFWFVNQLAERTSKVYPDKLIGTLAYIYTEEPPKDLPIHPNVAVWLCHMFPSCDSHPVATCPLNADYKRRAEAWSKLCKHLYVWHYIVDFAHYYNPFPNFRAMAADLKFYHGIGVEGVYLQGKSGGGGGGEFSLLRPYYGMKLLWDPDQDADAILRDFLEGYYGAASEPIWKYITLLHDKVQNENIHMHLYTNPAQGYLPDDVMKQAGVLFDQAEAAVKGDDEMLERVRVARMPLTYARIFPRNGYSLDNGKLVFSGDGAQMPETDEFLARMEKHGFKDIRESGGDPQQLKMLTLALNTPLDYVTVANEFLAVDVMPFVGGRALRITDRKSGQCVTAYNTTRALFFPFCGGEETRIGVGLVESLLGIMEPHNVVEKSDTSVTIEAKSGGVTLRRTVSVAPDKPVVTISAVVTNTGEQPREVPVFSHLELDLGDLVQTGVRFTDRAGRPIERDLKPIIAALREGEHYRDRNVPKGSWTFTGTKGLEVTQRFDDAQTDFTWLYAYPDYLNELEVEVRAKVVTLAPNESTTFAHEIEVRPVAK